MEITPKIVVCGDSFCSADWREKDHFSQILENQYGYSVTNLARGGASTVLICFQLQQAIALAPDIVVHSRTAAGRIEIPMPGKRFRSDLGLKNFIYANHFELSARGPYAGDLDAAIYANNVQSMVNNRDPMEFLKLSDEVKTAVQLYVTHMHDYHLKTETDGWLYEYWESKLAANHIRSIPFDTVGQEAYEFNERIPRYPKIYHTDRATQEQVAKNIHQQIQAKVAITQ